MKIKVNKNELKAALDFVAPAVARRAPRPVLECVRLSCNNCRKGLSVEATDLEIRCRYEVRQAEFKGKTVIVVPHAKLAAIVSNTDDEVIEIEAAANICRIVGSDAKYEIYTHDPDGLPAEDFTPDETFTVNGDPMADAFAKVSFAAAETSTHYAINGVLVRRLAAVATDGRRLAVAECVAWQPEEDVILPVRAAGMVGKMMQIAAGVSPGDTEWDSTEVGVSPNQVRFVCGRTAMTTALVDGSFPDWKKITRQSSPVTFRASVDRLVRDLRRAALMGDGVVQFRVAEDAYRISSREPETGTADIDSPLFEARGPQTLAEFCINPKFMIDALRACGSPFVEIGLEAADRPIQINEPGKAALGSKFKYVIMPVDLCKGGA